MTYPNGFYARWRTEPLPSDEWRLRQGRKIPRNLYMEWDDGCSEPVGQVETASLAALIVESVNRAIGEQVVSDE